MLTLYKYLECVDKGEWVSINPAAISSKYNLGAITHGYFGKKTYRYDEIWCKGFMTVWKRLENIETRL